MKIIVRLKKLINYSLKIKGIDKSNLWFYRALLSEKRGSLSNALNFWIKQQNILIVRIVSIL